MGWVNKGTASVEEEKSDSPEESVMLEGKDGRKYPPLPPGVPDHIRDQIRDAVAKSKIKPPLAAPLSTPDSPPLSDPTSTSPASSGWSEPPPGTVVPKPGGAPPPVMSLGRNRNRKPAPMTSTDDIDPVLKEYIDKAIDDRIHLVFTEMLLAYFQKKKP